MISEQLQKTLNIKLRKILDPVVEEAGLSPDDYEIVWKPLKALGVDMSKEELLARVKVLIEEGRLTLPENPIPFEDYLTHQDDIVKDVMMEDEE